MSGEWRNECESCRYQVKKVRCDACKKLSEYKPNYDVLERQLTEAKALIKALEEAVVYMQETCEVSGGDLCIDAGCPLPELGFCNCHETRGRRSEEV